jgi:hypothetical protein
MCSHQKQEQKQKQKQPLAQEQSRTLAKQETSNIWVLNSYSNISKPKPRRKNKQ